MIGSLRGTVIGRRAGEVLLEVGGVGYRVQLTGPAASRLPSDGAELFLHVHHHLREDHQSLYGFPTVSERDCFESLIAAHGVGPSLAMSVLSVHGPDRLVQILADGDVTALCQVPGVGKKTAARLLVELRAKLDVDTLLAATAVDGVGRNAAASAVVADTPRGVVRQALAELGYRPEEVRAVLDDLPEDEAADETGLLRAALFKLAGGR